MPSEALGRPSVAQLLRVGKRILHQISRSLGLIGFLCHGLDLSSFGMFTPQRARDWDVVTQLLMLCVMRWHSAHLDASQFGLSHLSGCH